MRLAIVAVAAGIAVAGCGGDSSSPAPEPSRLAFTVQPGPGEAGQTLTPPVQVSVQDASADLVADAENPVTLSLSPGSGADLGGTTTVDAVAGVATFSDLQISRPGTNYTLSASSPGLIGAISAGFEIAAVPGVPLAIEPAGGDGQMETVGQPVPIAPSVKVTDGFGDPVSSVSVTFSVSSGGGTAIGVDQMTDPSGVATVGQWTLGTKAGSNRLQASAAGLDGSPVTFTATGISGPAATMSPSAGDGQAADVGSDVAQPPAVLLTDAYQNPVSDVPVTFAVASGGGSVSEPSQTTGTDGVATVGSWTLGDSPGPNTLRATSAALAGTSVTFTAMATALGTSVTVEVYSNFFRSARNGSGAGGTLSNPFGKAAVDTIPVGGTVTWVWMGQGHNVTPFQNSAFTTSGTHNVPFSFGPITFTAKGSYRYRCTNHSSVQEFLGLTGMRGEIVVR